MFSLWYPLLLNYTHSHSFLSFHHCIVLFKNSSVKAEDLSDGISRKFYSLLFPPAFRFYNKDTWVCSVWDWCLCGSQWQTVSGVSQGFLHEVSAVTCFSLFSKTSSWSGEQILWYWKTFCLLVYKWHPHCGWGWLGVNAVLCSQFPALLSHSGELVWVHQCGERCVVMWS